VAEKTLKMIRIKWVKSGIGFTHHQKTIVGSLGLNKLNHTVVRPDTPQIRGIVAAVPHLLEIVPEPTPPSWASIPEYTVHAPAVVPAAPAESTPAETAEVAGEAVVAAEPAEKGTVVAQSAAPEVEAANASQEKEPSPEGSEPANASKE
jgi:large subunit ribosomal protein L30